MDIINPGSQKMRICRICLNDVQNTRFVVLDQPESKDVLDKLQTCFQLTIILKKYYPSVICYPCIEELNIAYNFHQKCTTFEERFSLLLEITERSLNNGCDKPQCIKKDIDDEFTKKKTKTNCSAGKSIFLCTVCNKTLKSKISLAKHKVAMHQKRKHLGKVTGFGTERRYYCTKCSYCTPHSQTLVNHMRRHNGDRPYSCHCGKSFTQASSLTAHKKTHSSMTYFTCTICGKQFKHAFTLKKHLNVHGKGKFLCELCNKHLKSRQSLQDHMYRHYNIRNFNCEDCGDTFVTHSELLNHKKKHGVVKKVECHLCGYKTHAKKTLIIHLKRHAGDKSVKCSQCQTSFYTKGDLQRHLRVHSRDKPYPCPTCAQRFAHSTSLNKHMSTVHGLKFKWADTKGKELRREKMKISYLK